jgi:hypothetical protein
VRILRSPNLVVAVALSLATVAFFGPHLMILGYKVAGARPPAALVFFCVLHHAGGPTSSPALVLRAPSVTAQR